MANVNLRSRAIAAGVEVYTPREFWQGKIDEAADGRRFLDTFCEKAPIYISQHPRADVVKEVLILMHGIYRHVLFGETEGRGPVAVALTGDEGKRPIER